MHTLELLNFLQSRDFPLAVESKHVCVLCSCFLVLHMFQFTSGRTSGVRFIPVHFWRPQTGKLAAASTSASTWV